MTGGLTEGIVLGVATGNEGDTSVDTAVHAFPPRTKEAGYDSIDEMRRDGGIKGSDVMGGVHTLDLEDTQLFRSYHLGHASKSAKERGRKREKERERERERAKSDYSDFIPPPPLRPAPDITYVHTD